MALATPLYDTAVEGTAAATARQGRDTNLERIFVSFFQQFDRLIRRDASFHAAFLVLGLAELLFLIFGFTFLMRSAALAIALAAIFLTIASYCTLRLYVHTRKQEQLKSLAEEYLQSCKTLLHYQKGIPSSHTTLSKACVLLSDRLRHRETLFYALPKWLSFLGKYTKRLSIWSHWQDVLHMRVLLCQHAIAEKTYLVRLAPTSVEAHAALANSYMALAALYREPRHRVADDTLENSFRSATECAIEEFRIMRHFSPRDPWIHAQLAANYHCINMPVEETLEYEALAELTPEDDAVLLQLGKLYFRQGRNAEGLEVYQQLADASSPNAAILIAYYGAYAEDKNINP